jgi:hypothetical protein
MLRLASFIIALLLAVSAIEPATGWFVALAALSGAGILLRPWRLFVSLPALRIAVFVIALLLAIGVAEPGTGWLVTLAVLTGVELTGLGRPDRKERHHWRRSWDWDFDWR